MAIFLSVLMNWMVEWKDIENDAFEEFYYIGLCRNAKNQKMKEKFKWFFLVNRNFWRSSDSKIVQLQHFLLKQPTLEDKSVKIRNSWAFFIKKATSQEKCLSSRKREYLKKQRELFMYSEKTHQEYPFFISCSFRLKNFLKNLKMKINFHHLRKTNFRFLGKRKLECFSSWKWN